MIDVNEVIARATQEARLNGCTCAVLVQVWTCDGDDHHQEHVRSLRRLHASKCRVMLRKFGRWN